MKNRGCHASEFAAEEGLAQVSYSRSQVLSHQTVGPTAFANPREKNYVRELYGDLGAGSFGIGAVLNLLLSHRESRYAEAIRIMIGRERPLPHHERGGQVAGARTEHARRLAVPDAGGRAADEATWPPRHVLEERPRALERPAEGQVTKMKEAHAARNAGPLCRSGWESTVQVRVYRIALPAGSFFTLKE